jgi:Flp pilus assembly protein TadD
LTALHLEAGRYAEALVAARHAAAGQPANPQIHGQLGILEAMQGHDARAEAALRRALHIHPGYAPARLALCRLFTNQGRIDSARAQLDIARRQLPGDARVEALARELEGR